MVKKLLLWMTVLLLTLPVCFAEGEWPELNADGYLDSGEFVYVNAEEGLWRYVAQDLKVEIIRYVVQEPKKLTWYEAEVWSRNGVNWGMVTNIEGKHMSSSDYPYVVARKNQTVLAINGDYAQTRYPAKDSSVGIIIRDGKVFSSRTKKGTYRGFPNLEVLALYPDGRMEVYDSDEKTADEYLEMGVTTTLAFGPWLIRDGQMNTDNIDALNKPNNPRTAIGMVEPGHTFAMLLEGRHKGSHGSQISFLAERMLEKGCTVAFNLDGGQTGCMVFMGEQINVVGGSKMKNGSARKATELLGIGTSELVPALEK